MSVCMWTIVAGSLVLVLGGTVGGRFAGLGGMSIAGALGVLILILGYFGVGC